MKNKTVLMVKPKIHWILIVGYLTGNVVTSALTGKMNLLICAIAMMHVIIFEVYRCFMDKLYYAEEIEDYYEEDAGDAEEMSANI